MSEFVIDQTGMDKLRSYVQDKVGAGITGAQIADARRGAPIDTGALKSSGYVTRMGPELWRLSFGRGLPDARAVYQEVGTGPHFFQPTFVDTDFSPLRGEHGGGVEPRAYIRFAMYRERSL